MGVISYDSIAVLGVEFPKLLNLEIPDEESAELSVLDKFDKDRLQMLIEKVVIYGEDAIEIVWKVENPFDNGYSV